MYIITSANVPDSTYSRTDEHEPTINDDSLTVYTGYGTRRGWGTPGTTSTVVVNDDDFAAIHVGFHHKHGGNQFWRYYMATGTEIKRLTWAALPDDMRQRVIDHCGTLPAWADMCGKLRTERKQPRETKRTAYKLMRLDGDRLYSLYDSDVEYVIGKRIGEAVGGGNHDRRVMLAEMGRHFGGFYSYPTGRQVMDLWEQGMLVPDRCYIPGAVYALVECEISGIVVPYPNGKMCSTYLRPNRILHTFAYSAEEVAA